VAYNIRVKTIRYSHDFLICSPKIQITTNQLVGSYLYFMFYLFTFEQYAKYRVTLDIVSQKQITRFFYFVMIDV
jgi:hypothetical protein